jgi:hypothetical protein
MSFLEIYDQDDIPLAPEPAPPRRRAGSDTAGVPAFLQTQRRRIVPSDWPPATARRVEASPPLAPASVWKTPFAIAMQVVACAAVIAAGGFVVTGFVQSKASRADAETVAQPPAVKSDRIVTSSAATPPASKDETRLAAADSASPAATARTDPPASAALDAIAAAAPAAPARPNVVQQLAALTPTDPNAAVVQAFRDAAAPAPARETADTGAPAAIADDQGQNGAEDAAPRQRVAARHAPHHAHPHRAAPPHRMVAPPARAQAGTAQANAAAPGADPVAAALRKIFNPKPADPNNRPLAGNPVP